VVANPNQQLHFSKVLAISLAINSGRKQANKIKNLF
jgi:hypothetical protein